MILCLSMVSVVGYIVTWAEMVQEVVTAIRKEGAATQMVIMPGNDFTSAAAFVESGSGSDSSYLPLIEAGTMSDVANSCFDECYKP